MGIFKKKPLVINFYEDTETIPLYNWVKYFETNDLTYFNKERKEHEKNNECMISVFNDYIKITDNHSFYLRFAKIHKILRLKTKYNCVLLICDILEKFDSKMNYDLFLELIKELEKWHYKIDKNKEVFTQIKKIKHRIKGIKTQIEFLEIELKDNDKEEAQSIEKQLILVSRGLELGYRLDAKEISLKYWVEMQKILEKETNEQRNRLNRK